MTRITQDLRQNLFHKIMRDLPSRDYIAEIHAVVQGVVEKHMPKEVKAVYDNPDLRGYLETFYFEVRNGNSNVPMSRSTSMVNTDRVYGLKSKIIIRMDDAVYQERLSGSSLYRDLVVTLAESGLVAGYFAQEELRRTVSKRLENNLYAAKTIKQLYQVLEPELHHFIPKDVEKSSVPSCVAPVVDDLKKLGAVLPEVAKAEVKS